MGKPARGLGASPKGDRGGPRNRGTGHASTIVGLMEELLMPVPDFQSFLLPTLRAFADGLETPVSVVRHHVAAAQGLTSEDLREMLPSGRHSTFVNRTSWAVIYVAQAGLIERTKRGVYRLMPEGERLLSQAPAYIDTKMLRQYPAYAKWKKQGRRRSADEEHISRQTDDLNETPEEALEHAAQRLRSALEAEVLDRVRKGEPRFLEQVILDLLVKMGYGGGDHAMGRVTGGSGDGGIDGTIREDALGLDEVYVQAKKYSDGNTVGESDLRNFAGAIDAAGTTKGVFVTTAGFTLSAKEYVVRSPKRIVLIDGAELARLMVQHGVGVRTRKQYEIKWIDEDYFDQEAR